MFTVIIAHFATRDEKLSANRIAGILLGIVGVALLVGPAALAGLHVQILGILAALAAALTYGFAGPFGRRFGGTPPLVTASGTGIASTIVTLPLVVLFERPWMHAAPSSSTWLALVGIGVLSTAIAYLLYFRILAAAGATNVALVTLLVPISAVLLGVLFLGEHLQWNMIAGMALIFAGLAAIDGRVLRRT